MLFSKVLILCLIGTLLCVSGKKSKPAKSVKEEMVEKYGNEGIREIKIPDLQSLFDSNCTYKKYEEVEKGACQLILFTQSNEIEVLLPIIQIGGNTSILIPFTLNMAQNETTLSSKAQDLIHMVNDTHNITILEKDVEVRKGAKNVLGMSYLEQSIVAIDFLSKEAGLASYTEEGREYLLNLPLESFRKDPKQKNITHVAKKHKELKLVMKKLVKDHETERQAIKDEIKKKEKDIKALKKQLKKDEAPKEVDDEDEDFEVKKHKKRKMKTDL